MSGPQCCSNPPTLNPTSGSGHVEKLCGLDSYLTGSSDSKLAIVLLSDIFGTHPPRQNLIFIHFSAFFLHYMTWVIFLTVKFVVCVCFCIWGLMPTDFQVVYVHGYSEYL